MRQGIAWALMEHTDDHRAGLGRVVEDILKVTPLELHDTIRVYFVCTAEALSTRLGHRYPLILNSWAKYYCNWEPRALKKNKDGLLEAYNGALRRRSRNLAALTSAPSASWATTPPRQTISATIASLPRPSRPNSGSAPVNGTARPGASRRRVWQTRHPCWRPSALLTTDESGLQRGKREHKCQMTTPAPMPSTVEIARAAACLRQAAELLEKCDHEWNSSITRASLRAQLYGFVREFSEVHDVVGLDSNADLSTVVSLGGSYLRRGFFQRVYRVSVIVVNLDCSFHSGVCR